MPTYEFELPGGEVVEEFLWMHEAPEIGVRYKLADGRMATRIVSGVGRGQTFVAPDVEHRMHFLPKKGSPRMKDWPEPPHRDAQGFGYCANQREIDQYQDKLSRMGRGGVKYDLPSFGRRK